MTIITITIIIAANPLSDHLGGKILKMMMKKVEILKMELSEMVTCVQRDAKGAHHDVIYAAKEDKFLI